jgi:hypothetical protein
MSYGYDYLLFCVAMQLNDVGAEVYLSAIVVARFKNLG